jgi:peptidoglycan/LPS O-acetylase OafA/YrhL
MINGARPVALSHMPQLDGLRAYAVIAVLVHHLLTQQILPSISAPSWGLLGVRLFFVLSGFLITGLLLEARRQAEIVGDTRFGVITRFYIRRALRIFPLYYLVLWGALLWGPADAREQLPWLATYTYNLWISGLGWYPDYFSHFWSLCVEEQFYLFWPWIVLFTPRRHLKYYALAMVLAAPLFRFSAIYAEVNGVASYTLTPSSLDALGLGALLAMYTNGCPASAEFERRLRVTVLPIAIAGLLLAAKSRWLNDVFSEMFIALAFMWLVAAASRDSTGVFGALLKFAPVMYLGKISYGIYVYHLLTPHVLNAITKTWGYPAFEKNALGFVGYTVLTIAVASLSWFLLERPLNGLKDRLPRLRMNRVKRGVLELERQQHRKPAVS